MKNIILIFFFPFLLISCQDKKLLQNTTPKFEWTAGISTPTGYEAAADATFIFGNNQNSSFSVDSPNLSAGNWGYGGNVVPVRGVTHIPTEIQSNWLSKAEGKYYKATVKIDTVKIKQLIAKGSGVDEYTNEPIQYSYITVGVAPGGVTAAWIASENNIEMVGWAKGEEDLNPPKISDIDYRNIVKKYGKAPFFGGVYDDGKYKGSSYWMQQENIDFATKHGNSYGSWDYYPKKYDWQPVVLSNKDYKIETFLFKINPVTGGKEELRNFDQWDDRKPILPAAYSWEEVQKFNLFEGQRTLPSFIGFSWSFMQGKEGAQSKLMLPLREMKTYFDKGFIKKDGTKGNYTKLVFEINKDQKVVVWLFGDLEHKLKLMEYQSDEKDGKSL